MMCKNSIENLITLLVEEEAAEARKRPKIIKLPDPTIFTITSPSQWQRNKLKSPDIEEARIVAPAQTVQPPGDPPDYHLSPPQDVPDCQDVVNNAPIPINKLFNEFQISLQFHASHSTLDCTKVSFQLDGPQPPEIEIVDIPVAPSVRVKLLAEIIKDEMVLVLDYKTPAVSTQTDEGGRDKNWSILRSV